MVFSGYLLNGVLQRRLQKATIKLEAFREVNRAAVRLISALIGLRHAFAIQTADSFTEDDLFDLVWQTGLARESEGPLDAGAIDRLAEDLRRASSHRGEEVQEWARATLVGLTNVYSRAFARQVDAIEVEIAHVNLVSKSNKVNAALRRFEDRVVQHSELSMARARSGTPSEEQIETEIEKLTAAWRDLTGAMRDDLKKTL